MKNSKANHQLLLNDISALCEILAAFERGEAKSDELKEAKSLFEDISFYKRFEDDETKALIEQISKRYCELCLNF